MSVRRLVALATSRYASAGACVAARDRAARRASGPAMPARHGCELTRKGSRCLPSTIGRPAACRAEVRRDRRWRSARGRSATRQPSSRRRAAGSSAAARSSRSRRRVSDAQIRDRRGRRPDRRSRDRGVRRTGNTTMRRDRRPRLRGAAGSRSPSRQARLRVSPPLVAVRRSRNSHAAVNGEDAVAGCRSRRARRRRQRRSSRRRSGPRCHDPRQAPTAGPGRGVRRGAASCHGPFDEELVEVRMAARLRGVDAGSRVMNREHRPIVAPRAAPARRPFRRRREHVPRRVADHGVEAGVRSSRGRRRRRTPLETRAPSGRTGSRAAISAAPCEAPVGQRRGQRRPDAAEMASARAANAEAGAPASPARTSRRTTDRRHALPSRQRAVPRPMSPASARSFSRTVLKRIVRLGCDAEATGQHRFRDRLAAPARSKSGSDAVVPCADRLNTDRGGHAVRGLRQPRAEQAVARPEVMVEKRQRADRRRASSATATAARAARPSG